jgi:large subunit ribosomal protein L14e
MIEVGRLCVKLAGRDAGKKCVVVDIIDKTFVLIDGSTRRRKCNVGHLEPLTQVLDIKKGCSHDDVVDAFKELGIELRETKKKEKMVRPIRMRGKDKVAVEEVKPKKDKKKAEKSEKPKKEKTVKKAETVESEE